LKQFKQSVVARVFALSALSALSLTGAASAAPEDLRERNGGSQAVPMAVIEDSGSASSRPRIFWLEAARLKVVRDYNGQVMNKLKDVWLMETPPAWSQPLKDEARSAESLHETLRMYRMALTTLFDQMTTMEKVAPSDERRVMLKRLGGLNGHLRLLVEEMDRKRGAPPPHMAPPPMVFSNDWEELQRELKLVTTRLRVLSDLTKFEIFNPKTGAVEVPTHPVRTPVVTAQRQPAIPFVLPEIEQAPLKELGCALNSLLRHTKAHEGVAEGTWTSALPTSVNGDAQLLELLRSYSKFFEIALLAVGDFEGTSEYRHFAQVREDARKLRLFKAKVTFLLTTLNELDSSIALRTQPSQQFNLSEPSLSGYADIHTQTRAVTQRLKNLLKSHKMARSAEGD
jgi:hypothetical protein